MKMNDSNVGGHDRDGDRFDWLSMWCVLQF